MEQKRVSFKVAKAIKEAGYPQCEDWWYSENGELGDDWLPHIQYCASPTYLDVWLWLWREKGIGTSIDISCNTMTSVGRGIWLAHHNSDPEYAIIKAIDNLVDYHLIK